MPDAAIHRVQDPDGRGPFKPGRSQLWCAPDRDGPPSIVDEFGLEWQAEIPTGWHAGCGFERVEQVAAWFSAEEIRRLELLGYRLVVLRGCRVLRRSPDQVLFVREPPLRRGATVLPWPRPTGAPHGR
jgi:hypothetical protein